MIDYFVWGIIIGALMVVAGMMLSILLTLSVVVVFVIDIKDHFKKESGASPVPSRMIGEFKRFK